MPEVCDSEMMRVNLQELREIWVRWFDWETTRFPGAEMDVLPGIRSDDVEALNEAGETARPARWVKPETLGATSRMVEEQRWADRLCHAY